MFNNDKSTYCYDWIKICFDYFESHVDQRFRLFNFYILISLPLLSSIYFGFINHQFTLPKMAYFFELIITYIFWRLDERRRILIKNAERVIKNIEHDKFELVIEKYSLFIHEMQETIEEKKNRCCLLKYVFPITNTECFRTLFGIVFVGSSAMIYYMYTYAN